ncbi:MAG: YfcC family protein [Gibbsiella quercinecans]|uniref:YfcC family protein n=1 Tax=Gibbsiella quercinecans TaxID=929813 RepID=UPI003F32C04C
MNLKLPSSFTILFLIIIAISVMTWIIPAGHYDTVEGTNILKAGTYQTIAKNPQGLFEILMSPVRGFSVSLGVVLFILIIGGFLGVIAKTGALDAGIASVVKNSEGNAKKLIPILFFIAAVGGSTYGFGEETVAFIPLILPVMIATRLDPLVGVATILLGSEIGILASTVNPFATGVASAAANISLGEGISWRLLIFVSNVAIAILYLYRYAQRVEKNKNNSLMIKTWDEDQQYWKKESDIEGMTKTQKIALMLMCITFVIMIVSIIPWDSLNNKWTFFITGKAWLSHTFFGKIIGDIPALGTWYFNELSMLFFGMSIIIGLVARLSEKEIVESFIAGSKDLLGVALLVALAKGIQVVMDGGHITATILHWGEQALTGVSPAVFGIFVYLFYLPMYFFIPSTSGLAGATIGITSELSRFAGVAPHVVITAFQAASGLTSIITPTSGILMAGLAVGRINFGIWLKFVAKLVAMLFVLDMLIIAIAAHISAFP